MRVLEGLAPERVFYYFEEICRIPHGSGNIEQISNYLMDFAKKRGLYAVQDALKNVIIVKPATSGYEEEPAVILQGHMDMVAVKKPDCPIDMAVDGLRLKVRGDKIYAEGTSLGGDDGIAVAYALALLEADNLSHPKLEVVITVDEEVGMDGARGIDLSSLSGRRMLNLDSEEEGIFLTSCAGGARMECRLPMSVCEKEGLVCRISVEGLMGGHSGAEIHKERGNANCLMGRILNSLASKVALSIKSMEGGLADNAIPRQTVCEVVLKKEQEDTFKALLLELEGQIKKELASKDKDFQITAVFTGEDHTICADGESTKQAAAFLAALPNGVQAMSADVEGLVETSLNLGMVSYTAGSKELRCTFSLRSCIESAKQALVEKVEAVTMLAGGSCDISGDYPGWAYRVHSPLRDKMAALYEEMYGEKPRLEAIHAGLECGILAAKLEDLDCISFGPNMENIHTTEETLSVSSVARVWDYLVRLLAQKNI